MKIKSGVALKLAGLLLAFSLVPVVGTTLVARETLHDAVGLAVGHGLQETATQTMTIVDQLLTFITEDMEVWSADAVMQEVTTQDRDGRLSDWLKTEKFRQGKFAEIYCADLSGQIVASSKATPIVTSVSDDAWFKELIEKQHLIVHSFLPDSLGDGVSVNFVVPIFATGSETELIGALSARLNWSELNSLVDEVTVAGMQQSQEGFLVLLDSDGDMITGPDFLMEDEEELEGSLWGRNFLHDGLASAKLALNEKSGSLIETMPSGNAVLVGYSASDGHKDFPGLGWAVLAIQSSNVAFVAASDLQKLLTIIGIIVFVIASFAAVLISRRITHPVRELALAAQAISDGDFDREIGIHSSDEFGVLAGDFKVMRDELRLRESDRLANRALIAALPDTVIRIDKNGKCLQIYGEVVKTSSIFQCADECTDLDKVFFPEVATQIASALRQLFDTGKLQQFEAQHVNEGQTKFYEMRLVCCGDTEAVLMLRDVTDRVELEQQLLQAQKLESIGQLAAGIAHEINTPAQYVGDNTRFLQDAYGDISTLIDKMGELAANSDASIPSESIQQALKEADVEYLQEEIPRAIGESLEGVTRVTNIVRAMKEFSHPAQEKTQVDLNKAIESTIAVSTNEWKYVAEMKTDFDPELPPVICRPGEFNQVILNMLVNAAHAISDVVADDAGSQGTITVCTRRVDDWAEITIADSGNGMPADVKARVFDPFFTTKEVGKGTGQGLSIAYSVVVEMHGGTITVDSEPGEGACFTIRLPLEGPQSDQVTEAA